MSCSRTAWGLLGGLLLSGVLQPRPPDAVIAMIRPEVDTTESAGDFSPRLTAYLWPDSGGEMRLGWRKESEPGIQLLGLRQGW